MPTLFHAAHSRSTRIIRLLEALATPDRLQHVSVRYMDGGGRGPDPANPHPDKKVPATVHDHALVTGAGGARGRMRRAGMRAG
ncbi:thioredoxin domain-containing protein [Methylobacterium planeticum]|uniref:Uncharacterized protein n=1 Tax=Methylobacterium planeticum TaxID=2615211 RepID=A0A6N6MUT1_9HYPH|nr:hypothetical protein [Methylobacterium planeticum]KAB1073491.1 hypothetical protein F6X51_12195 [Methylobacterium planeticum]